MILVLGFQVQAQDITASIAGRVADSSGGVVPGASVTLTSEETGRARTALTDENGNYQFLRVNRGFYSLQVELPGFKTFLQKGIELQVNQNATNNVVLEVGGMEELVTVESNVLQVETTKATLGKVVDREKILNLPLIGGNYLQLATLQPGVTPNGNATAIGANAGGFSVNGSRGQSNNYMFEGADNNDQAAGFPDVTPSIGSIQEFKILTNNYDAEFGRSGGSVVNVIARSGTREYHGNLFEFFRNDVLNTRNFFTPTRPLLRRNLFGGTLGGPIPKLENTFFFTSLQFLRQVAGAVGTAAFVPTAAVRAGDISGLGAGIIDPQTGEPFPNGMIPSNRIHPISKVLLERYVPLPTGPDIGGRGQFSSSPPNNTTSDQFLIKIDHDITDNNHLAGTYIIDSTGATAAFAFGQPGNTLPGFGTTSDVRFQNVVLRDTHIFTPTVINDFRVAFHRRGSQGVFPVDLTDPASLGFTGVFPDSPEFQGVPNIRVTGFFTIGNTIQGPQSRFDNTAQVFDTVNWTTGNHALKFGGEWRAYQQNQLFSFINSGVFTFDRDPSVGGSGSALVDFLIGLPDFYQQNTTDRLGLRQKNLNFFVHDDWKVNEKVSLNLGLRYELNFPGYDYFDRAAAFVPDVVTGRFGDLPNAPLNVLFAGEGGVPRGIYELDKNDFSPRIGIVYSPMDSDRLSIRAGAGLFYDLQNLETNLQFLGIQPFGVEQQNAVFPGYVPFNTFEDPAGATNVFSAAGRPAIASEFALPYNFTPIDTGFKTPSVMQYNLTVQYEMFRDYLLEVGYVATQGRNLVNRRQFNWVPFTVDGNGVIERTLAPTLTGRRLEDLGSITIQESASSSNYNSLQASVNKRFSNGLGFLAAYTWSHSLDDTSGLRGSQFFDPTNRANRYGNSDFDLRHRFVISYNYELPFFKDQHGVVGHVLGGWSLNGITSFNTGFPLTGTYSIDTSGIGVGGNVARARGGDPTISGDRDNSEKISQWFNVSAFGTPANPASFSPRDLDGDGTLDVLRAFGNAGRNTIFGPGFKNWDFSLIKRTGITEDLNFEFRAEFFNLFNHTNFGQPQANLASAQRGVIATAGASRLIQFGVKINF